MNRGVCASGGVIAVLIAQTLGFAGVASAANIGPDAQGWWSEAQQAPQPLPVDAVSGPNLQVGGDPTGPNAIAAVRYIVPGTIDDVPVDPASVPATLTLEVAPNTTIGTPAVVACRVLGSWQPASAGTWSTRPVYNCDRTAKGTLSGDKATMVFKLDPALQAHPGAYDVALVPAPDNQAPFSVQFLPAGANSLALGSGSSVATPAGDAGAAVSSSDTPPLWSDAAVGGVPGGPSPSFDAGPPLPLGSAPAVQPAAPVVRPGASRLLPAPIRRAVSTKRSQQAIALAMLGAIALSVWWFGGEQTRAPRLLGSLGEGVQVEDPNLYVRTGGIGRFARARTKPPARL
jgi:hypothetical protein